MLGFDRSRRLSGALAGIALLVLTAGAVTAGGATHASATIRDGSGAPIGWAKLTEDGTGRLHLNVHVAGLTPGLHGIHLHAVGQCDGPAFGSALGHHNPLGGVPQHGLENPLGSHAGDLPNLIVNQNGRGHLDATSDRATLVSLLEGDGSAIVIHAYVDDQRTNPIGNSGARVACGVLVAN